MTKQLKIKDFLLIALLTALYMLIYFATMLISAPFGPFGHAISPGICALFSGTVLYFMSKKVGKMWQFTLMTFLIMAIFTLLGGGYLPWLISSVAMAILADVLASSSKNTSLIKLAIASGFMHVGQAWGAIIPSLFFVEKYKEEWIQRGQSIKDMEELIKYTTGVWSFISTVVVFLMAIAGIYLGYFILRKHFKEN
ncbi:MptD family putative ECF transporter S component [Streptococcus porcinus]